MKKILSKSGELSVLLAAVLWGCIGFFTRDLQQAGFSAVQIVAVRAFITTVSLALVILIADRKLFKIHFKDIWMFFGTGICSFLFFNICYMSSIGENSLSVACILMYTSPIWVTTLSAFLFKERMTHPKLTALLLCMAGCVLVCFSSSLKLTKIGLLFGLLSGLGYALYSIFGKYASAKYNTLTITFYTFLFASFGALPICNVTALPTALQSGTNIILCIGIAVTSTILPYLFYTFGLSKIGAGKASVISIAEPAVAAVVGMIRFSENIGIMGFCGIVTVMGGLIYLEHSKSD